MALPQVGLTGSGWLRRSASRLPPHTPEAQDSLTLRVRELAFAKYRVWPKLIFMMSTVPYGFYSSAA